MTRDPAPTPDATTPAAAPTPDATPPAAAPTTAAPTLVVGWDRTAAGERALTVAADLATRLGAQLRVVHVVDLRDFPVDPDADDWELRARDEVQAEVTTVQQQLAGRAQAWQFDLRRGDPVRALLAAARESNALMIVVGTRGGSGVSQALSRLLGAARSVPHALERADLPVLVVPHRPPDHSRPPHHRPPPAPPPPTPTKRPRRSGPDEPAPPAAPRLRAAGAPRRFD